MLTHDPCRETGSHICGSCLDRYITRRDAPLAAFGREPQGADLVDAEKCAADQIRSKTHRNRAAERLGSFQPRTAYGFEARAVLPVREPFGRRPGERGEGLRRARTAMPASARLATGRARSPGARDRLSADADHHGRRRPLPLRPGFRAECRRAWRRSAGCRSAISAGAPEPSPAPAARALTASCAATPASSDSCSGSGERHARGGAAGWRGDCRRARSRLARRGRVRPAARPPRSTARRLARAASRSASALVESMVVVEDQAVSARKVEAAMVHLGAA